MPTSAKQVEDSLKECIRFTNYKKWENQVLMVFLE
jgi:hypothetical protein